MTVESATYLDDLVATNPAAGDGAGEGDDHIRLVKSVLQATFPNMDAAVTPSAANVNTAIPAITTEETAASVTIEDRGYPPGDARRYYDGGGDWAVAIQAAIDQCEQGGPAVVLPAGTLTFGSTLECADSVTITGQGIRNTILSYSGAAEGITNKTPGTRVYWWTFRDFTLQSTGSGTIGLYLEDVSQSYFERVDVTDFTTCVNIESGGGSGWAIRNRFVDCRYGSCDTAVSIGSNTNPSTNANHFYACRASAPKYYGWVILNGNDNCIMETAIESMTNHATAVAAVDIQLSIAGTVLNNVVQNCRFETNTGGVGTAYSIRMAAGTKTSQLVNNYILSTGGDIQDNSTETAGNCIYGSYNGIAHGYKYKNPVSGNDDIGWHMERTITGGSGGSQNAAYLVEDSHTSSGSPVTLEAKTGRDGDIADGARVLKVSGSGGEVFGIHGTGAICTNQALTGQVVGGGVAPGTLPFYDETGTLIGYVQLYATSS